MIIVYQIIEVEVLQKVQLNLNWLYVEQLFLYLVQQAVSHARCPCVSLSAETRYVVCHGSRGAPCKICALYSTC